MRDGKRRTKMDKMEKYKYYLEKIDREENGQLVSRPMSTIEIAIYRAALNDERKRYLTGKW